MRFLYQVNNNASLSLNTSKVVLFKKKKMMEGDFTFLPLCSIFSPSPQILRPTSTEQFPFITIKHSITILMSRNFIWDIKTSRLIINCEETYSWNSFFNLKSINVVNNSTKIWQKYQIFKYRPHQLKNRNSYFVLMVRYRSSLIFYKAIYEYPKSLRDSKDTRKTQIR